MSHCGIGLPFPPTGASAGGYDVDEVPAAPRSVDMSLASCRGFPRSNFRRLSSATRQLQTAPWKLRAGNAFETEGAQGVIVHRARVADIANATNCRVSALGSRCTTQKRPTTHDHLPQPAATCSNRVVRREARRVREVVAQHLGDKLTGVLNALRGSVGRLAKLYTYGLERAGAPRESFA